MSQKNSEILGNEWIAPSLVESEYPGLIFQEDSIASVDFISQEDIIFQEDSIASVDFISQEDIIFQEDSIAPPGIDVDPLTGIANNSMVNARHNNNWRISLKNTRLTVHPLDSQVVRDVIVSVTFKVELDPYLRLLVNHDYVDLIVQSTLWGIDGGWNKNDHLFNFPNYEITREGYFTINKQVSRSVLNEDRSWFDNRDELQATIKVTSSDSAFPLNKQTFTPIKTGYFY